MVMVDKKKLRISACILIFSLLISCGIILFPSELKASRGLTVTSFFSFDTSSIGGWINSLYRYGLVIVGVVAAVAIVFAGIQYMTSMGNPEAVKRAKQGIVAGLSGLILLLLSHMILKTIDPRLVQVGVEVPEFYPSSGLSVEVLAKGGKLFGEAVKAENRKEALVKCEEKYGEECEEIDVAKGKEEGFWDCFCRYGSPSYCQKENESGGKPSKENCQKHSGSDFDCVYKNGKCVVKGKAPKGKEKCEEDTDCPEGYICNTKKGIHKGECFRPGSLRNGENCKGWPDSICESGECEGETGGGDVDFCRGGNSCAREGLSCNKGDCCPGYYCDDPDEYLLVKEVGGEVIDTGKKTGDRCYPKGILPAGAPCEGFWDDICESGDCNDKIGVDYCRPRKGEKIPSGGWCSKDDECRSGKCEVIKKKIISLNVPTPNAKCK